MDHSFLKRLSIEEVKDTILRALNEGNAVHTFYQSKSLAGHLDEKRVLEGKYRLTGSIHLDFKEVEDHGNQRMILKNVSFSISSQIKDNMNNVCHNSTRKVIRGTTSDIVINWIFEEEQDSTARVEPFRINENYKIINI